MALVAGQTAHRVADSNADQPNLQALLEQARKLQASTQNVAQVLPAVALGLEQIESQSRALAARARHELAESRDGASNVDARAQYLLASARVNTDALSHELDRLEPLRAFLPLQPMHDNNIEGLVRHAYEATIINAVEENRKKIVADFYRRLQADLHTNWQREREAILDELSRRISPVNPTADHSDRSSALHSKMKSIPSLSAGDSGSLTARQARFARAVYDLNSARIAKQPFDVPRIFSGVVQQSSTEGRLARSVSVWRLLEMLVRDRHSASDALVGARAYAQAYDEPADTPAARQLRRSLVTGGLQYLEEHFLAHVLERELTEKANTAAIGGIPSIFKKVEAYVRLQESRARWSNLETFRSQSRDEALWANVFFLVRCGCRKQAGEYARLHETRLTSSSPLFVPCFCRWVTHADRQIPKNEREQITDYYVSHLRHRSSTCDPFKLALHKLLARADIARKRIPAVTERTEDWFWLQLALTQEEEPGERWVGESWSLLDLGREMVMRYSAETFGAAYPHMLLLAGQFEQAIAHMYERGYQQLESVHLAIALAYYGLLRLPKTKQESDLQLLVPEDQHRYGLDFNKLIHRYYRPFAAQAPSEALQYICLLPMAGIGTEVAHLQQSVARDWVRNLVIDTAAYSTLLGDMTRDGTVIEGAVFQMSPLLEPAASQRSSYVRTLIREVAQCAETDENVFIAILLFNLAEDADSVMRVLNTRLGNELNRPTPTSPLGSMKSTTTSSDFASQDAFAAAETLVEYYQRGRGGMKGPSPQLLTTCEHLILMRKASDALQRSEAHTALSLLQTTDILPTRTTDISAIVRKAEELKDMDDAIVKNMGSILLLAMNALYTLHAEMKASNWGDAGRQLKLNEYRMQARALMTFAGMLRFRLQTGVFEQLSRLDAFL